MRVLLFSLVLIAGCKGDRDKCEAACRNAYTLTYWRKADKDIAAAPAPEREAMRRKRLGMFESELEGGVELCINQCTSANNEAQVTCLIEAKSADAIDGCIKE